MSFTKADLLKAIKPYVKHKDILNAVFLEINKALVRKEVVMINCFGTFHLIKSKVKYGQQFKSGKRIRLNPQYRIKFHASEVINKIVNDRNLI